MGQAAVPSPRIPAFVVEEPIKICRKGQTLNWQQKFLRHQRKGNSLISSCEAAGVGLGQVDHYRRHHSVFNTAVRKLIKANNLATPRGKQNISVTNKHSRSRDLSDFWDRWDDAAAAGVLVKEFGNGS